MTMSAVDINQRRRTDGLSRQVPRSVNNYTCQFG